MGTDMGVLWRSVACYLDFPPSFFMRFLVLILFNLSVVRFSTIHLPLSIHSFLCFLLGMFSLFFLEHHVPVSYYTFPLCSLGNLPPTMYHTIGDDVLGNDGFQHKWLYPTSGALGDLKEEEKAIFPQNEGISETAEKVKPFRAQWKMDWFANCGYFCPSILDTVQALSEMFSALEEDDGPMGGGIRAVEEEIGSLAKMMGVGEQSGNEELFRKFSPGKRKGRQKKEF